jgi:hypothetical protein
LTESFRYSSPLLSWAWFSTTVTNPVDTSTLRQASAASSPNRRLDSKVRPVHFHDLRHTGNQFAADDGASLRELMERMGHASPRAAMIYLHVSKGRSRHIADRLSIRLREARPKRGDDALGHAEGTQPLNEAEENGAVSRESRSDLHERGGGDEGT